MDSIDYEFLSSEKFAMAEVNVEIAQEEQFQEMVLEPPQVQDVLLQPEAQIAQGQQMIMEEYLAGQERVQAGNAAAVHKQMETIRFAMKAPCLYFYRFSSCWSKDYDHLQCSFSPAAVWRKSR